MKLSRKDVLAFSASSALALAASRAARAMAGAMPLGPGAYRNPNAGDLSRLTTAALRLLPPLQPATTIRRSGRKQHFTLIIASAMVEPLPGHNVQLPTINGISPGPVLRMTEGDDVEVVVINRLAKATSIHWHGVPVPFPMDGAAMFSQEPIPSLQQFTYRWTAPQAGTYMYHSHFNDMEQESVAGMIVVEPQTSGREPHYAVDVPLMVTSVDWEPARQVAAQAILANSMLMPSMAVNPKADPNPGMGDAMERMDMTEYWCFNGKTFPATAPIRVKQGDLVRVRFANMSHMTHPMHLHGHWFRWIAQDGVPVAHPYAMNTIPVDPGRTIEIDFIANNPGVWPLHCHIVSHMVDNRDLMSGLVAVVQYEGFSLPEMMRSLSAD